MIPLASTLPSGDGSVAAAYIVFFALILIYVAIMAMRLTRVERKLRDMQREHAGEQPSVGGGPAQARGTEAGGERGAEAGGERELV